MHQKSDVTQILTTRRMQVKRSGKAEKVETITLLGAATHLSMGAPIYNPDGSILDITDVLDNLGLFKRKGRELHKIRYLLSIAYYTDLHPSYICAALENIFGKSDVK